MARTSKKTVVGRGARQRKRRLAAGALFDEGVSRAEVARRLNVTWRAAHTWYLIWQAQGTDGLGAVRKPGPDPKFNARHAERLASLLAKGALAHGYPNALWTIPRIRRLIWEELGLKASGSEVWRLLRRMGWSPQKPAKRARERNEAAITRWKREQWPRILEQAQTEGRTIVFVDESGLSMKPSRKRSWAPQAQTPVLEFCFNWKKLSAIGGMSFKQIYFRLHEGSIKAPEVVEFLKHLSAQIPGSLTIVWDGLRAHWGDVVKEHVAATEGRIRLEQLPAYAPELNPVEYLWAQVKQHEMANFTPKDLHELSAMARRALRKVRRAPRYIRAFWIQSELPLG